MLFVTTAKASLLICVAVWRLRCDALRLRMQRLKPWISLEFSAGQQFELQIGASPKSFAWLTSATPRLA